MVDIGTWTRLSAEDQGEYAHYSPSFIKAVRQSDATDGMSFEQLYHVASDGEHFFLTNGSGPFAGIKSQSREGIEALLADAVQNYGR
jgi:hypothetical protein